MGVTPRPSGSRCLPSGPALAIVSVEGDGAGNITVDFSLPVTAADIDATEFLADIDNGVNPAVQVTPNSVTFACGTSNPGNPWSTTSLFLAGCPAASGTIS